MVRRHPLGAFFLLAFVLSWGYWIPVAMAGGRWSHFPGLLGPMVAALVVSAITRGGDGVRHLLVGMGRWRLPLRWYATVGPLLGVAAVILGVEALLGRAPSLQELSTLPGVPEVGWVGVFTLTFLLNGYGEEAGWRGFAWTELRRRHNLSGAALLLAIPWATWHIPTFWIDSGMRGFQLFMIPGFLVGMAAGAVVLGWIYENAGSSVLLVALWHTTLNMVSATRAFEGPGAAAVSATVIAWAIVILRREHAREAMAPPASAAPDPTCVLGEPATPGIDLFWIPLGAATHSVRFNGVVYEALSAARERRPRCDLYHSVLAITLPSGRFMVEMTPVPDRCGARRGVVAEGPVGVHRAGRLRLFRYEVRRWRDGVVPDLSYAVASPITVTRDPVLARAAFELVARVPTPTWGRDELDAGEMWSCNSVTSWVLAMVGIDVEAIALPADGRAPGWDAGRAVARRAMIPARERAPSAVGAA